MKRIPFKNVGLLPTTHQGQLIVRTVAIITGVACLLHLIIGASPIVVSAAFFTILLSFVPVASFGFLNIGAILVSLVGFRYVGFPLIAKLVVGQPIDSYLIDPVGSYGVVLLGLLGYLCALIMAINLSTYRSFLIPPSNKSILGRISFLAAAIGVSANLSVALRAGRYYQGVTIAEFFVSFLHLALICAIARVLQSSGRRRSVDIWVVILLISEITFAMVRNSRMALLETFLCFMVTIVAFEVKIKWRQISIKLFTIAVIIILSTPVFLYVRDSRNDLSWTQRIESTLKMVMKWPEAFAYYQSYKDKVYRRGWHLNYYGSPQNVFERMTFVNHVDVIKAGTDSLGTIGLEDLKLCLKRAIPRIISTDKPRDFSQGTWLYEKLGFSNQGPFATAPLIGTGYAAFGWIGAFLYPFFLGLIWLLIIKKISGWSLQGNVWAIFLLLRLQNRFVEGSSDAYVLQILRSFPQDVLLLWIVEGVAKGRFLHPWRRNIAHITGK